MKKLIIAILILSVAVSCKKLTKAPYGPTDVRIRNTMTTTMNNVTVHTFDSTFNFGTINGNSVSDYHRYNRAYPWANISVYINGIRYKTDTVTLQNFGYMQYLSTIKVTYEIKMVDNKIVIQDCVQESELK